MAGSMTIADVCQLLAEKGFAEDVVEVFRDNKIDGSVLVDLTAEDMKELGVNALGDRKKLKSLIGSLPEHSDTLDRPSIMPQSDTLGPCLSPLSDSPASSPDTFNSSKTPPPPPPPPPPRRPLGLAQNTSDPHQNEPKLQETVCKENLPPAKRLKLFNINSVELPAHFSRRVQDAIERQQLHVEDNRCAFVREVVAFFEGILPYPTEEEYTAISKTVVDRYPCLKDTRTSKYWATLHKQITQRYRNNRRKGRGAVKPKLLIPAAASVQSHVPQTTPAPPETNDEEYQENLAALQKLFLAKNPPAKLVGELLNLTRAARMEWLLRAPVSIAEIIQKFPPLGFPKWVLAEFNLEMREEDMLGMITSNWEEVCVKLLPGQTPGTTLEFSDEKRVLQTIIKNIYHKKPGAQVIEFVECSGKIEEQFRSKILEPRLVVFSDDEEILQMFVCAENSDLFEVPSLKLIDGITYMIGSYYVYNVDYPGGSKNLLYFIQDVLMGKPDSGRNRPTRLSTFINRIGF